MGCTIIGFLCQIVVNNKLLDTEDIPLLICISCTAVIHGIVEGCTDEGSSLKKEE